MSFATAVALVTSHRLGPLSPCALRTLRAYVDCTAAVSNFYLHRFSRYSTPNMALQKIILTFLFLFCFSFSSRSRAMRSPCHIFSKILSNRNEISQTCLRVNVVVPNTFWVHSVRGGLEFGDLKVTKYFDIFPMLFQAEFQTSRFSLRYISTESEQLDGFRRTIAHWKRIFKG